jgi:hypothetical protein
MRKLRISTRAVLTCTLFLSASAFAAGSPQEIAPATAGTIAAKDSQGKISKRGHAKKKSGLSSDERLALLASALDAKTPRYAERDCSHLVHAIYERAGFPYDYADSDDLYAGVSGFQRVSHPESGDLVVWHGHAGMVVRPSKHLFFSFLHAGPGIDDYQSPYWKGRGQARFFRYSRGSRCDGCRASK